MPLTPNTRPGLLTPTTYCRRRRRAETQPTKVSQTREVRYRHVHAAVRRLSRHKAAQRQLLQVRQYGAHSAQLPLEQYGVGGV